MALEQYFTPMNQQPPTGAGSADWWKMIAQANEMPPDQAQVQSTMTKDQSDKIGAPQVPIVEPFVAGKGLSNYLPPTSTPAEKALIEQYKQKAQEALLRQGQGIDQLEGYRNDFANKPLKTDYSALAGLADVMNGAFGHKTNLADLAEKTRPMNEDEKNDKLLKLQEYIQGAKNNMSGEDLKANSQLLGMLHQQNMDRHNAAVEKASADRSQAFLDRNDIARDNQTQHAGDLFDKDALLKTLQTRSQQINIDRHTLATSDVVPTQVMDEMAMGLGAAISGSKAVGLEQTKMLQLSSLEKDIAKARSYGGQPMNALTSDQRKFLLNTFDRLGNAYEQAMESRAKQLRDGRRFSYNPGANTMLDNKVNTYKARPLPQDTSSSGPAVGAIEDGHKFLGGDPSDAKNWEQQ